MGGRCQQRVKSSLSSEILLDVDVKFQPFAVVDDLDGRRDWYGFVPRNSQCPASEWSLGIITGVFSDGNQLSHCPLLSRCRDLSKGNAP